jgi:hypothetical protein
MLDNRPHPSSLLNLALDEALDLRELHVDMPEDMILLRVGLLASQLDIFMPTAQADEWVRLFTEAYCLPPQVLSEQHLL